MTRTVNIALTLAAITALPALAMAKPKTVGSTAPLACGLKALPMAKGNTWTYRSGGQQVVIKVTDVQNAKDAAGKPATTIVLEEQVAGRTLVTNLSCTPTGGLQVPLDSFFFSGEPGGMLAGTLAMTSHDKATLLPDDQVIPENGWIEIVKADVTRPDAGAAGAVHLPAKLEVERHVTVKDSENLMIGLGQFTAQKVVFELRGRGIVNEEKTEIPVKRPGTAYLVKGVGYVKLDDAFERTWELIETNLVAK